MFILIATHSLSDERLFVHTDSADGLAIVKVKIQGNSHFLQVD